MTLRLTWLSDRMVGGYSAYSKVTAETCSRLAKLGHKVAHIPMGRSNRMGKWSYQGVLIYPSGFDPWCEDVAIQHYIDWKADMLITLKEPWVFNNIFRYAINFVPFAIIDHSPVSPAITTRLHTAFRILAPSRFAQRELKSANIENVHYLPHACRTDLFRPLEGRKAECKKMWFLDEDDFTVLIVAMNRSRKMIPRMLRGYKLFKERNPDVKSHLMLWCDVQPAGGEAYEGAVGVGVSDVGVNLLPEIMDLGLGEAVRWPDRKLIQEGVPDWAGEDYVGGWDMVKLYNAADCIFLCSGGEAAGMPLLEGAACGVIGVTTEYAGGPEYVGPGLTVKMEDYMILNTPGTRYALASLDGMAEALTRVLNADPTKLAKKARTFAERYSWERIISDYWKPFLEEAESELKPLITKEEGVKTWA